MNYAPGHQHEHFLHLLDQLTEAKRGSLLPELMASKRQSWGLNSVVWPSSLTTVRRPLVLTRDALLILAQKPSLADLTVILGCGLVQGDHPSLPPLTLRPRG